MHQQICVTWVCVWDDTILCQLMRADWAGPIKILVLWPDRIISITSSYYYSTRAMGHHPSDTSFSEHSILVSGSWSRKNSCLSWLGWFCHPDVISSHDDVWFWRNLNNLIQHWVDGKVWVWVWCLFVRWLLRFENEYFWQSYFRDESCPKFSFHPV